MTAAQKMHPWVRAWWERTWATWEAERETHPTRMCTNRGEPKPKRRVTSNCGWQRVGLRWSEHLAELWDGTAVEVAQRLGVCPKTIQNARNRYPRPDAEAAP